MIDFFIAFFGSLFYGAKAIGYKADQNNRIVSQKIEESKREEWRKKWVNEALEGSLNKKIDIEGYKFYHKETDPVYDEIFTEHNVLDVYCPPMIRKKRDYKHAEDYARREHHNALRIMLARRGYVDYFSTLGNSIMMTCPLDRLVYHWCAEELARHGLRTKLRTSNRNILYWDIIND